VIKPEQEEDLEVLETRRDNLYSRLEAGYAYIEALLESQMPTEEAEDFWVGLLREYERVCDELQKVLGASAYETLNAPPRSAEETREAFYGHSDS
jgi:hypothetical protein